MANRRKRRSNGQDGRSRDWTVVTFEELEAWRLLQALPKKRVADRLGVTNSTYHNWASGAAVATPATQHKIHALIHGHDGHAAAHDGAGRPGPGRNGRTPDQHAVLSSTALIVNAYVQSAAARLSPEELCQLIRNVSGALTS